MFYYLNKNHTNRSCCVMNWKQYFATYLHFCTYILLSCAEWLELYNRVFLYTVSTFGFNFNFVFSFSTCSPCLKRRIPYRNPSGHEVFYAIAVRLFCKRRQKVFKKNVCKIKYFFFPIRICTLLSNWLLTSRNLSLRIFIGEAVSFCVHFE